MTRNINYNNLLIKKLNFYQIFTIHLNFKIFNMSNEGIF